MSSRAPLTVLYGGSFDPVHNGHLAVARNARDILQAQVRLMPAADPPHKGPTGASAQQRAQMLQLAVADIPGLAVDLRELDRDGPSYTVDTLRQLRDEVGGTTPWAILLGADSFLGLPGWKQWRALFGLAHIVIAERPGSSLEAVAPELEQEVSQRWAVQPADLHATPSGLVYRLQQPLLPESASAIRAAIAAGTPWRHWVDPAVADFIDREGLYR